MNLFTETQYATLIENGDLHKESLNNVPCALLVTNVHGDLSYWLITELYKDQPELAFGLYESKGNPILGTIELSIFSEMMEKNFTVFNNLAFSTEYKISIFKQVAEEVGEIITRPEGYEKIFARAARLTGGL